MNRLMRIALVEGTVGMAVIARRKDRVRYYRNPTSPSRVRLCRCAHALAIAGKGKVVPSWDGWWYHPQRA